MRLTKRQIDMAVRRSGIPKRDIKELAFLSEQARHHANRGDPEGRILADGIDKILRELTRFPES